MRVYLVIIDDTVEARVALRFASRRASKTGGELHLLALIPPQPFSAFATVQATIEEEARENTEVLLATVVGNILTENGKMPQISVVQGDAVKAVRSYMSEHPEVSALVLGAAATGEPGPLVAHFAGLDAGSMPCPVFVIPGSLSEADIDRLS